MSRSFARDPLAALDAMAARGDRFEELRIGRRRVLLVADPDAARDVLVAQSRCFVKQAVIAVSGSGRLPSPSSSIMSSDPGEHLRGRRSLQPAFGRSRLVERVPAVREAAEQVVGGWRDGEVVDVEAAMRRLAVTVVDRVLFDGRLAADGVQLAAAAGEFISSFSLVLTRRSRARDLLRVRAGLRFAQALEQIDAVMARAVREAEPGDSGVACLLAQTRGEEADRELAGTAFGVFLAGVETTSVALAWACALLAEHPDEAARLAGDPARAEAVFAETLRLYPPAWYIGRLAVEPARVGGISLAPGAMVLVSVYALHRLERHYVEPLRFRPDRWDAGALAERKGAFTYLPFGAGARQCIGEQLAWSEGVELLGALARRAVLEPAGHAPRPRPRASASLSPATPLCLRVRLRPAD